jgi:predicted ATPase
LTELPKNRWTNWNPVLPAPRSFAAQLARQLEGCSSPVRRLIESAAVIDPQATIAVLAALAEVSEVLPALDEAVDLRLLRLTRSDTGPRRVTFVRPLARAAVYRQMNSGRRIALHRPAAALMEDRADTLRHRVVAAISPDPGLAAELALFARERADPG